MRKIILIALLLALPLVCFGQDAVTKATPEYEDSPLQLTIRSDKEVYEVGEDIFIDYKIANITNEKITLAPLFFKDGIIAPTLFGAGFIIKRVGQDDSMEVTPSVDWSFMGISRDEIIVLESGKSYSQRVCIAGNAHQRDGIIIPYSADVYLQQVGKYEITGKYKWSEARKNYPTSDCWKGTLTSNTITIAVVEKRRSSLNN